MKTSTAIQTQKSPAAMTMRGRKLLSKEKRNGGMLFIQYIKQFIWRIDRDTAELGKVIDIDGHYTIKEDVQHSPSLLSSTMAANNGSASSSSFVNSFMFSFPSISTSGDSGRLFRRTFATPGLLVAGFSTFTGFMSLFASHSRSLFARVSPCKYVHKLFNAPAVII